MECKLEFQYCLAIRCLLEEHAAGLTNRFLPLKVINVCICVITAQIVSNRIVCHNFDFEGSITN